MHVYAIHNEYVKNILLSTNESKITSNNRCFVLVETLFRISSDLSVKFEFALFKFIAFTLDISFICLLDVLFERV